MFAKDGIFDRTAVTTASKALDTYALRGKAMANNMANITTPGYRRIEVAFEEKLREALDPDKLGASRTDENHFHAGKVPVKLVQAQAYRAVDATNPGELNNVDVDLEMSKLAENSINYNFSIRFIQDRMGAIESAIKQRA